MTVIVFDVNETLSDMSPLAQRFIDVGAPGSMMATWFASTLRDGIALTAAGSARPFAEVAGGVLDVLWSHLPAPPSDPAAATAHVLDGFRSLQPHPDVAVAARDLAASGHRLITLSNGAASVAEELLDRAGLRDLFELVLSVDDVEGGAWKPDARAYQYAARRCEVQAGAAVLVAVHPWDVHGARQAGLRTVYLDRSGAPYPGVFAPAEQTVNALTDLVDVLGS